MNSSIDNKRTNVFWGWIAPGLYLAMALFIDYLTPGGTITPLFVVVGLTVMAMRLKPVQMSPWTIIYVLVVGLIFTCPSIHAIFSHTSFRDQMPLPRYARAATYLFVGVGFCYLCIILNRLLKSQRELMDMLSKVPCPIVVSDHNGRLLYWNQKMEELIPILGDPKKKKQKAFSFFDLLAPRETQGKTISCYLQRLESNQPLEPLDLSVGGRPIKGKTQLMEWSGKKIILTILEEGNAS